MDQERFELSYQELEAAIVADNSDEKNKILFICALDIFKDFHRCVRKIAQEKNNS